MDSIKSRKNFLTLEYLYTSGKYAKIITGDTDSRFIINKLVISNPAVNYITKKIGS